MAEEKDILDDIDDNEDESVDVTESSGEVVEADPDIDVDLVPDKIDKDAPLGGIGIDFTELANVLPVVS